MTDEIKLPKVTTRQVFVVECSHKQCQNRPIGYAKKRPKADEIGAAHKAAHKEHNDRVAAVLASLSKDATTLEAATGQVLTPTLLCPTCKVGIGDAHKADCDVARCLLTGEPRMLRDHIKNHGIAGPAERHDGDMQYSMHCFCGQDFSGPDAESVTAAYDKHVVEDLAHSCGVDAWMGYWPGEYEAARYGVPVSILKKWGHWDAEQMTWILPDDWQERAQAEYDEAQTQQNQRSQE